MESNTYGGLMSILDVIRDGETGRFGTQIRRLADYWNRNVTTIREIAEAGCGPIIVQCEIDSVRFIYSHRGQRDEEWQSEDYPVEVEWTACNYGGSRPWFRCPARGCGRRVAILNANLCVKGSKGKT